jgi:hypothetical protein
MGIPKWSNDPRSGFAQDLQHNKSASFTAGFPETLEISDIVFDDKRCHWKRLLVPKESSKRFASWGI